MNMLAIESGKPSFAQPLHVGRPNLCDTRRLSERFEGILQRRWFTNDGPVVREFEQKIMDLTGVRH